MDVVLIRRLHFEVRPAFLNIQVGSDCSLIAGGVPCLCIIVRELACSVYLEVKTCAPTRGGGRLTLPFCLERGVIGCPGLSFQWPGCGFAPSGSPALTRAQQSFDILDHTHSMRIWSTAGCLRRMIGGIWSFYPELRDNPFWTAADSAQSFSTRIDFGVDSYRSWFLWTTACLIHSQSGSAIVSIHPAFNIRHHVTWHNNPSTLMLASTRWTRLHVDLRAALGPR